MNENVSEIATKLLRPKDVAQRLQISQRQIYLLLGSGQMPQPFKIGRQNRWRAVDIETYIESLAAQRPIHNSPAA